MIYVRTALAWCACVGENDADLPTADQIEKHLDRSQGCDHHAIEMNGSVKLLTCPNCIAD